MINSLKPIKVVDAELLGSFDKEYNFTLWENMYWKGQVSKG